MDGQATELNKTRLPQHLAIIMDGNGRWAKARGMMRTQGHHRGLEILRQTVRDVGELGIPNLTLYSFSSENWSRPQQEINDLMGLLKYFIRKDLAELHTENVKVRIIGRRDDLPDDIAPLIDEAESLTKDNTGLTLMIAFNYGSQDEIARCAAKLAQQAVEGEISPDDITPELIEKNLDTAGVPAPDMILRTSGEQRLSNFLMWQAAYAELVFIDCHWPDFNAQELHNAVAEYQSRDRRYGGVKEGAAS
jgi:undecaprenyl diphosphate synthase